MENELIKLDIESRTEDEMTSFAKHIMSLDSMSIYRDKDISYSTYIKNEMLKLTDEGEDGMISEFITKEYLLSLPLEHIRDSKPKYRLDN